MENHKNYIKKIIALEQNNYLVEIIYKCQAIIDK